MHGQGIMFALCLNDTQNTYFSRINFQSHSAPYSKSIANEINFEWTENYDSNNEEATI